MPKSRWPTILALIIVAIATWLGWFWVWGLLFIFWGLVAIRDGDAFFVEPLSRTENPVLFWVVVLMWFSFGLWYILASLM